MVNNGGSDPSGKEFTKWIICIKIPLSFAD